MKLVRHRFYIDEEKGSPGLELCLTDYEYRLLRDAVKRSADEDNSFPHKKLLEDMDRVVGDALS